MYRNKIAIFSADFLRSKNCAILDMPFVATFWRHKYCAIFAKYFLLGGSLKKESFASLTLNNLAFSKHYINQLLLFFLYVIMPTMCVLLEIVRRSIQGAKESDYEDAAKMWFRYSLDREGGRKFRYSCS